MNIRIGLALAALVGILMILAALPASETEATPLARLKAKYAQRETPSVDHSKFAVLRGPFKRPQDVTAACIGCHNQRHTEVMKSSHWNWAGVEYVPGRGIRTLGKRNILNNYCIGVESSEKSCAKCHIGYGLGDGKFNFNDPTNVDCLACHDNSNTYVKASGAGGMPDPSVNLVNVAEHVGLPQRANCGTCHFFGGGGNNVKHGDLEKAMFDPDAEIDVHMADELDNMQCVDCHTAKKHQMLGKSYSVSSMNRDRVQCETCHGDLPHKDDVINKHMLKVACQTCHIPTYAKANPTKLTWDWSTAGKLKDGKPYVDEQPDGTDSYMSIKGSFTWGKNLKPDYVWFNGTAKHYLLGDKIDPSGVTNMNTLLGSYSDPDAKIIPVKIHVANQIYDTQYLTMIQPKLFSEHPGDGGYWGDFNWNTAAAAGMAAVGLPYSGHYGFAKTRMFWPINHMVAPKSEALKCEECHTQNGSRLAKLTDFYLPGRDHSNPVDWLGKALIALTILGVLGHGVGRAVSGKANKNRGHDA